VKKKAKEKKLEYLPENMRETGQKSRSSADQRVPNDEWRLGKRRTRKAASFLLGGLKKTS